MVYMLGKVQILVSTIAAITEICLPFPFF
jgi:hypothetical protein